MKLLFPIYDEKFLPLCKSLTIVMKLLAGIILILAWIASAVWLGNQVSNQAGSEPSEYGFDKEPHTSYEGRNPE